jgi:hypothetical protein
LFSLGFSASQPMLTRPRACCNCQKLQGFAGTQDDGGDDD